MYPKPKADEWVTQKNLPFVHRAAIFLGILPVASQKVRRTKLSDPVPLFSELNQMLYVVPQALVPFAVRYYFYHYVSKELPGVWTTWILATTFAFTFSIYWLYFLKHLCIKYGYFNDARERDMIPFSEVPKVAKEVVAAVFVRTALVCFSSYDQKAAPYMSVWTPVHLFLFTLIEDFYYYWFHRVCHESKRAWDVHRLHHTTKAPNVLLLGYASDLQEYFDILLVPLLAWYTFPIPFDEFMVWMLIHISIQIHGHGGIRLHHSSLLTAPFLKPFGLEIVTEDHDLHHRHGWRESYNYGKQSRFWDSLFGTTGERIEGHDANIDKTKFIY